MNHFEQKKNSTIIKIDLEANGVSFSMKDKISSNTYFINYESISNDVEYFNEEHTWYRNIGLLWGAIGLLQFYTILQQGRIMLPFWLAVGLICIFIYFKTKVSYSYIKTQSGNLLIIKNKQHDSIFDTIYRERNKYLLATYNTISDDAKNFPDNEIGKFAWLLKLGVIDQNRFNEVEITLKKMKEDLKSKKSVEKAAE